MKILLDTCVYIWCLADDKRLTQQIRNCICDAESVYVSIISFWEIAIKSQLGKLKANIPKMITEIEPSGFSALPLKYEHIVQLNQLPMHHKDPFDRMLLAQALCEPLQFLTVDDQLAQYSELVRVV